MMYKIENMEIAKIDRSGSANSLIRQLKVGEGFYAPLAKQRSLASRACHIGKALKCRFGVYKVDDERVQVVRREDPK